MKFTKSILTGTGAVVLAGLILALLAPRAARAIAATAVQVMNTTATPVPTQGIMPGSIYKMSCRVDEPFYESCALTPTIPSGYVFHATHQWMYATYNSPP